MPEPERIQRRVMAGATRIAFIDNHTGHAFGLAGTPIIRGVRLQC